MPNEPAEDEPLESRFKEVLNDHLHKLCSMHDITPLIMTVVYGIRAAVHKEKGEFLEKHGEVQKDDGDSKHYTVPLTHSGKIKIIDRRLRRAATAYETLPPSFVVAMVSEYDAFLGQLIAEFLRVKPELLSSSEKNISFRELQEFGSIDAARERIVEKEVESVLRTSHTDQFAWLERKLGVELSKGLDSWSTFIELTERRNLFVHCDGIVSSQYLQVCRNNRVKLDDGVELGTQLGASRDYIRKAYECLYEISVKLTQVVWRRLLPHELSRADSALINVTYELLDEKQNRLANNLLTFAVETLKRWDSEANRRVFIINYAQSYYHRGMKEEAVKVLDKEDWTACSDDFRLCEMVLREKFDAAFALMRNMGKDSSIEESSYMDWPVFRDFRKHEKFSEIYEDIFGRAPVDHTELEEDEDDYSELESESENGNDNEKFH